MARRSHCLFRGNPSLERSDKMLQRPAVAWILISSFALAPLVGCENLPGNKKTQGAVIGGVGGAVAGAALGGSKNRLLGALLGGALGAGGGYLIGANWDKINGHTRDEGRESADRDKRHHA